MSIKSFVNDSYVQNRDNIEKSKTLVGLTIFLGIFLNHSMRLGGFNLSLADFVLVILLVILFLDSKIYIPKYSFLFFVALFTMTLLTTLFFTPIFLGVQASLSDVLSGLAKLCVSFLYFIIGVNLARERMLDVALKWFSFGALIIALLGIVMEFLGLRLFSDILFYGDFRFRGFMSDPNFYAILVCSAFVYYALMPFRLPFLKWLALIILTLSILLTGSKTGLIAFIILVIAVLVLKMVREKKFTQIFLTVLGGGILLTKISELRRIISQLSDSYSSTYPQLERISVLFSDNAIDALSEKGSGRDVAWTQGLSIIEASPVWGVGVGSYNEVSQSMFSSRLLAHNTYIQLAAEWGLIFTLIFFIWVISLLIRYDFLRSINTMSIEPIILRGIILSFLIGSISLSLNNARMFWFFLGMLGFMSYQKMAASDGRIVSSVKPDK